MECQFYLAQKNKKIYCLYVLKAFPSLVIVYKTNPGYPPPPSRSLPLTFYDDLKQ